MKKWIIGIILMISVFGIIYLLGSFYSLSFDISKWKEIVRSFVACMGGTVSVLIGVLYISYPEELR